MWPRFLSLLLISAAFSLISSVDAQTNPFRSLTSVPVSEPRSSAVAPSKDQELKLSNYLLNFRLLGILETSSGQVLALIRQGNRTLQLRDGAQLGDQPVVLSIRRTSQSLRAYARYRRQLLELTP